MERQRGRSRKGNNIQWKGGEKAAGKVSERSRKGGEKAAEGQ